MIRPAEGGVFKQPVKADLCFMCLRLKPDVAFVFVVGCLRLVISRLNKHQKMLMEPFRGSPTVLIKAYEFRYTAKTI